jgi:hypothetical protein
MTLAKIEDKFEVEIVRLIGDEIIESFESISEFHKALR